MISELRGSELENIKFFLFDLMLRDLTWGDRSATALASIFLADDVVRSLFTPEEISVVEMKMGVTQNELEEVIALTSSDVPIQLISSKT